MIVLDTNVLSALMRQSPDAKVIAWLDRQPRTSVWTTSVTILDRSNMSLEHFNASLWAKKNRTALGRMIGPAVQNIMHSTVLNSP